MAKRLFDPASANPFALSRSKVELFIACPRCFYLDRRLGISRPEGFPFNLNSAVDALLKAEYDICRATGAPHPMMVEAGIQAIPHSHPDLNTWRSNFKGIRVRHEPTNLELFGAIDDLWRDTVTDELIVVDYKATSKDGEVTIDADWQSGYKRQMEFYQWLLRRRGFRVARRGWFVYCNGRRDVGRFDSKLEFKVKLIPYDGDDGWVESTIHHARNVLELSAPPSADPGCDYCSYVASISKLAEPM